MSDNVFKGILGLRSSSAKAATEHASRETAHAKDNLVASHAEYGKIHGDEKGDASHAAAGAAHAAAGAALTSAKTHSENIAALSTSQAAMKLTSNIYAK